MLVRLANAIEIAGNSISDALIELAIRMECKRLAVIRKISEFLFNLSMRLFGMAGGK